MNTYQSLGCLVLMTAGACSDPSSLEDVDIQRMGILADFHSEPPISRASAGVTYAYDGDDCPALSVAAHLDGVPFLDFPGSTGRVSNGCQVGFFLAELPPAAAESTIRFSDASAEVSYAVARLLEPRLMIPSVPEGSVLNVGDRIDFTWPVDTDELQAPWVSAHFVRGMETTQAEHELVGHRATVTVPSLTPGDWTISLGVIAEAAVIRCVGAPKCIATVSGGGELAVTIQ